MLNWKALGPDGLQGFWLKYLKSTRLVLAEALNNSLDQQDIPDWLTKEKTILISKDEERKEMWSQISDQ